MKGQQKAQELWEDFCNRFDVLSESVPLFSESEGIVETIPYGKDYKLVLKRSEAMEKRIDHFHAQLKKDFVEDNQFYDGMIYVMHRIEHESIIPLYIGRSKKLANDGSKLNSDITDVPFGRWAYDTAQHMGALSVAVLGKYSGRSDQKPKRSYLHWANALFEEVPAQKPQLKSKVYFWAKPWSVKDIGIWKELGPTSLAIQENLLIAVARLAYPGHLLNIQ